MNGVLVVDKPAGPTSHDVVARVRAAIRVPRVGHTGTLDPLATGVLPLVIGRATRLAQFLTVDEKEYVAGIRLGYATATYDAEDRILRADPRGPIALGPPSRSVTVAEGDVVAALPGFLGTFWQVPPPYSAKKVGGTKAYELARRQKNVELPAVEVTVRELELVSCTPGLVTLRIVCSSGFYVRALAHELGQRLACGAHLESLRRTRAGDFTAEGAVPLETIQREGPDALRRLIPLADVLARLPQVVVNARGARRAAHGNALSAEDLAGGEGTVATGTGPGPTRVVTADGTLLAIGEPSRGGVLQPVVVLV